MSSAARVGLLVCGASAAGLAAHCWRGETPLLDWVYFDLGGKLVVSNTAEVLQEVTDLLEATRRLGVPLADVDALIVTGGDSRRADLVSLMHHATRDLPLLSDAISRRYFRLSDDEPHRVAPRFEHKR